MRAADAIACPRTMALLDHTPRFRPDDAVRALRQTFGLDGDVRALPSERDQNFRIAAEDGHAWVLKVSNSGEREGVVEMETEGSGVRSLLVRVGPTGSEFGTRMPADRLPEILASWKYWGVLRHLHWMPAESVARTIANALDVPVAALPASWGRTKSAYR